MDYIVDFLIHFNREILPKVGPKDSTTVKVSGNWINITFDMASLTEEEMNRFETELRMSFEYAEAEFMIKAIQKKRVNNQYLVSLNIH